MEAKNKLCKKCETVTKHRLVRDKDYPYYTCSICSENNSKKHRQKHWYRYLSQKANARKKIGSVKLNEQQILALAEKQNYLCALSGKRFDIMSKWYKPSLDRIDSNKGYTLDNIRLVAWIVNHSKGELTDKEFINMCKAVTSNKEVYGAR